ncbi:iron complex outermembrane recepter protein [Sphingomonas sp. OV641]|uniref:TonB-dependent receptor n=1 Tax=Sphingomonas sp. OV641 TaxID=1881068 RepID=UPI0008D6F7DE|nr:TonB-dependent receptor [Sphingomonas sp. OV641]SEJ67274.1 iron complex outermembrane recepter protein [Sphingomonas sp. OV641]
MIRTSVLMIMACAASAPAWAQSRDPAPDQQETADILVTAERREERAQDVPIALSVVTSDTLEQQGMANLDRIGAAVPNLYLARNFGTSSGALVFLRGVGEGDSIFTNDPPVGIYVDDVILPRSTGSLLDLVDVERVEVLRGPQGTLYGRNTSGGAIRLVMKRPSLDRASAVADIAVGSYGRTDARTAANIPVTDTIALRVSAIARHQQGWGRNLTNGARVNGQDLLGARAAILWAPSPAATIYATLDLTRDRSGPRFPQRFAPDPERPGRYTNTFLAPEGDIDAFPSADTDPLNSTDTGGVSLRADYRFAGATLTAITGYRWLQSRIGFDQTANPPGSGANVILLQDQDQHSFSQEVHLAGDALAHRVEWLVGAYYFSEHNDQLTGISLATPTGPDARFRKADFFNAPSRGAGSSGNWSPYEPRLDTSSYALFGSATMALGDRTRVTAGLRYTNESKRYAVSFLSAPDVVLALPDGRPARRRIASRWTDLSPRLTVDHRLEIGGAAGEAMIYALASKGFRSGSFDGRARNVDFVMNRQGAIAPETVWNYEAGVKSDWLDRRLHLNATYFVNDYTNIAFSASRTTAGPPDIFRQNVGDARIQGLEVEWSARPLPGVEIGGWVATLADRFTRLASSPGCTAFVPDERDLDLRFTPALRYQVRASVTQQVGAARLRVGGDYSASSPYSIALCNEPQHRVTNASQINVQVDLDWRDWGVQVTATNLADRRYNTGSVGSIGYPAAPREWMLRISREF